RSEANSPPEHMVIAPMLLRGSPVCDALRRRFGAGTRSVQGRHSTRSVGTIKRLFTPWRAARSTPYNPVTPYLGPRPPYRIYSVRWPTRSVAGTLKPGQLL